VQKIWDTSAHALKSEYRFLAIEGRKSAISCEQVINGGKCFILFGRQRHTILTGQAKEQLGLQCAFQMQVMFAFLVILVFEL
jgi:hypothetical protein